MCQKTFIMFLARVFLFRLRESPSWLVSVGRREDAVQVLSQIADINGSHGAVNLESDSLVFNAEDGGSESPNMSYPPPSRDVDDVDLEPDRKLDQALSGDHWQAALSARMNVLLKPPMRSTTLLVWAIWGLVSAAYTFGLFRCTVLL